MKLKKSVILSSVFAASIAFTVTGSFASSNNHSKGHYTHGSSTGLTQGHLKQKNSDEHPAKVNSSKKNSDIIIFYKLLSPSLS